MTGGMLESEATIRLVAFLAIFGSMAAFELWSPRLERPEMRGALKSRRWLTNLSIVILSSALLRIVFPAAAVGAALWAEANGYGLMRLAGLNGVIAGIIAFVVLDFAVWFEHLVSHKIPLLWRIHRMHHADTGFDVTTALRFHPLEILLSMLWKAAIVIALGAPVVSVLIFEIVLNGTSMFNHSNVRLPDRVDAILRRVIVTPDMHRVHHSTNPAETDSNYGFNFAFWDRLLSTYVHAPALGQEGINIGLNEYRDDRPAGLWWSLVLPFRRVGRRLSRS
jgi:sterol desaturase/sphingolipid hydroxylase (fatty acid hydroxylase superfamily)|uniref:Fatty acid hydroxylase domain-containing protein n=1 Tax=viral metagenome TaxID=1070528 RepID=A0A6H1ZHL6_9ZZZZ